MQAPAWIRPSANLVEHPIPRPARRIIIGIPRAPVLDMIDPSIPGYARDRARAMIQIAILYPVAHHPLIIAAEREPRITMQRDRATSSWPGGRGLTR